MAIADGRLLEHASEILEEAEERLRNLKRTVAPEERVAAQMNLTRAYSDRLGKYAPFDGTNYLCPKCAIELGLQTVIRQAGASDMTLWRCGRGHTLPLAEPDD